MRPVAIWPKALLPKLDDDFAKPGFHPVLNNTFVLNDCK
jgi:hypothetical protein